METLVFFGTILGCVLTISSICVIVYKEWSLVWRVEISIALFYCLITFLAAITNTLTLIGSGPNV